MGRNWGAFICGITSVITEMTDYMESQQPASEAWKTQPGWVLYDGECRLCTRWVHRFELPLKRRGFGLRPLQSAWARERLGLDSAELLREMRLVFPDGKIKGGADAIVELSRHFWWGLPVYWFCRLPTIMSLLRAVYRYVAMRRCNEGACAAPLAARRPFWWEWFPLIVLPGMALLTRTVLPAWGFMWLIAFAI